MWAGIRLISRIRPEQNAAISEIFENVSLRFIWMICALYMLWHITAAVSWPGLLALRTYAVSILFFGASLASMSLTRRRFLLAQVIWQAGLALSIILAAVLYQAPLAGLLLALLPLIGVIAVNVSYGVLVEVLIILLSAALARSQLVAGFGQSSVMWVSLVGGVAGLIGWVVSQSLLAVAEWSLVEYRRVRKDVDEAREQRVEMKQVQQDLQHANNELARLANRLKALTQVAEEARRTKEEFLANVSHELRTPLNMIIGFSEMIVQSPEVYGGRLPPKLLADITTILRNSQHLSRLVNDVLDLSQAEAGRITLHKEWCSPADIINSAIVAIRPLFEMRGLYLHVHIPDDLPQIFCDSTRVRQVLLNLLSNAGRFTEKGGVQLYAQAQQGELIIRVKDDGPGIAAEDQARIFDPFEQLDHGINRRAGGNGLGLSISKRFIEMHEGRMWLESELGQGTTFFFSLPVDQRVPATSELNHVLRWYTPGLVDSLQLRKRRSPDPTYLPRLVVWERESALSALLSKYATGLDVITVHDAESARAELSHSPAQALVINSEEGALIERPADLPYQTPIIQCWAPGEQAINQKMGTLRYLVKPISSEVLFSAIQASGENVKKILLVEDNLEVQQLIVRQLSTARKGYQVLRAGDGDQALQVLREQPIDLVLLDLMLPGQSGYEVLETKSQDPAIRDIPVIVISAVGPEGRYNLGSRFTFIHPGKPTILEFLSCVLSFSAILLPESATDHPAPAESPAG